MARKTLPWGHLDKFSLIFNSFQKAIEACGKPEKLVPGYLETVRFFLSALNEFDIFFRIISIAREKRNLKVSELAYKNALLRIKRASRYMNHSIDFSEAMIDNWQRPEIHNRLDEIGSEVNWTDLGEQMFALTGKLEFDLNEYMENIWVETSESIRTSSLSFARNFTKLLYVCRKSLAQFESEIVEEMRSGEPDPILTWKKVALAAILGAVIGACLGSGCKACGLALRAGAFAVSFTCAWKSQSKNDITR